jgi:23S rRNA pseudouridine1911/1915/1917 synthase
VTDQTARVAEGEVYEIAVPEAAETDMRAEEIALTVVHEDDDLAVIDKPPGLVVHPAPGTPTGTLVNALLHHFGEDLSGVGGEKRPGVVHRIDKDTSGLLVVAKSDAAHHGLAGSSRRTRPSGSISPSATACRTRATRGCVASGA